MAGPDYGLITNRGRAHLEGFGGEDGVRKTKGELYAWLAATGGMAFVRRDDPVLAGMAAERAIDTGSRKSPGMKVYEYDVSLADGMESNLEGDYNRFNIAAAVAAGRFLGRGPDENRSAVRDYVPGNNR